MGLLKEPRESKTGLAGKRGPTIFDKVVRWRKQKAVKGKFQREFERETKKMVRDIVRTVKKGAHDVYNESD